MKWISAALVMASFVLSTPAVGQTPKTDAERQDILRHLPWQHGGTFHLSASKATLTVSENLRVVTGPDAIRFMEVIQGTAWKRGADAIVLNRGTREFVVFEPVTEGYVRLDDWNQVNADSLLKGIRKSTEAANKERAASGMGPIEVIGWREVPTLDRETQTVHWTVSAKGSDTETFVNAVSLVFGRFGFEKLTWVGRFDQDPTKFLTEMRQGFHFDPGAQYADFRPGDKKAAYGIAALIATLVGAKVAAKIGLLAILLGVAKKLSIVIIAAGAGLFGFLRRLFTGKLNIEERGA